jgi:hypothetical protein
MVSSLRVLWLKCCMHFSFPLWMIHSSPVSSSLIWSRILYAMTEFLFNVVLAVNASSKFNSTDTGRYGCLRTILNISTVEISDSHSDDYEDYCLLGCCALQFSSNWSSGDALMMETVSTSKTSSLSTRLHGATAKTTSDYILASCCVSIRFQFDSQYSHDNLQ